MTKPSDQVAAIAWAFEDDCRKNWIGEISSRVLSLEAKLEEIEDELQTTEPQFYLLHSAIDRILHGSHV